MTKSLKHLHSITTAEAERRADSSAGKAQRTVQRIDPRLVSQALSGVIYDFDAQRGTTVRSEGLFELLGFHADEVAADVEWWNGRIHPDDRARVDFAFRSAEVHCQVEYRILHREGHYVHIWDQALIVRDKHGVIQRIVGNNLDISRHKEIENALQIAYSSEREAREVAELNAFYLGRLHRISTGFSLALTSKDIAETLVNELGATLEADRALLFAPTIDGLSLKLLASSGCEFASANDPLTVSLNANYPFCDTFKKGRTHYLPEDMFVTSEYPLYNSLFTTQLHGRLFSFPLVIDRRILGVVVLEFAEARELAEDEQQFLSITALECAQAFERSRLYEAERNSRERAEEASKAKDEFFAVVSHELRSPLQSILGWIRLARTSKLDAAASERALEVMERNTRAQIQLVSDLLEASRIVTGKVLIASEATSIGGVLDAALDSVRPAALEKGVELQAEISPLLPFISGDANRLQQVFSNLLSNAVKFTPRGGQISVLAKPEESTVHISVCDSGEGIEPAFLPRVFERYAQSDDTRARLHGGLGLGLAIARHIIELHHGRIYAESEGLGRGATFHVVLPVDSTMQVNKLNQTTTIVRQNRLKGIKVLVVEDTKDTRDLLCAVLQADGAIVALAESAAAALKIIKQFQPQVLLSDIGLPDEDGCALLQRIRQDWSARELPAAALTALVSAEEKRRCLRTGFQAHVSKPIDPDELVSQIEILFKSREPVQR